MRWVLTNLGSSRKSNRIIGGRGSSKGLINEERLKKSNYVQLGKVTTRSDMISVCILKQNKYHRWVILMFSDSRESLNKRRNLCGYQENILASVALGNRVVYYGER